MRLVTWNCKGAFHRKHQPISALQADVLVVPEAAQFPQDLASPIGGSPVRSVCWTGATPRKGLGVLAYGDYSARVHPDWDPSIRWVLPVEVSGPVCFLLFAVWAMPAPDIASGRYTAPSLWALERYRALQSGQPVVWAGDFNANVGLDRPLSRHKFSDFVRQLAALDIHSLYHRSRGVAHGAEPESTFFLQHNPEKGLHIDFVFASGSLHARRLRTLLGTHGHWCRLSDHMPLAFDLA